MSLPKGSKRLAQFLEAAGVGMQRAGAVCCVVGNEAADLDSMASAVMFAYHLATRNENDGTAFVPVINIPRGDYKLRTEAAFLFQEAGIDPELLLFAEDADLAKLHSAGRLRMILVDHNRPAGGHSAFQDTVEGVVDHHADEGLFTDASIRVLEPVGSTATLVARAILKENANALEEGSALLLLGTILLDTVNLDPEAGRVTPEDEVIAKKLLALTGADQQELFDALQREKFNVSALDSSDLLRKDYKEWTMGKLQVGVSSVLLSIEDWLHKDADLSGSLAAFAQSRGLDLLLAMNAYTDPEFTRELVVYCPDPSIRNKVVPFLESADLGLSPIASGTVDEATALYSQANKGISRKKLQPLLSDFLD